MQRDVAVMGLTTAVTTQRTPRAAGLLYVSILRPGGTRP